MNNTHRHLPHRDPEGVIQFVTFRLANSLPGNIWKSLNALAQAWQKQHGSSPESKVLYHKRLIAQIDKSLDQSARDGTSPLYLQNPEIARLLIQHLQTGGNQRRYVLHAYCIMPNHVHVLIEALPKNFELSTYEPTWSDYFQRQLEAIGHDQRQPQEADRLNYWPLSKIMKTLKGVSARDANKILSRSGALWQDESFDHIVRNEGEYTKIIQYIVDNPVMAGFVKKPADWPYSFCWQSS